MKNKEYLKKIAVAAEEYEEICENIRDEAENAVEKVFEKHRGEITEETIELNGYNVDALVYNMAISDELIDDLSKVCIEFYEIYIESYFEFLEKTVPEKLKDELDLDIDSLKKEAIESFVFEIKQFVQYTDLTADVKLYLDKKEGKMRKAVLGKEGNSAILYFSDEIKLEYSEGEKIIASARIYSIENSDTKSYCFELVSHENEQESINGVFEIVKSENRYNFFIRLMNGEIIEEIFFESVGRFSYSENSFEISPEYIKFDDRVVYPGITVGISSDTYIMEYENDKNIFSLSENEILGISERITKIFSEVSEGLQNRSYETGSYTESIYGYGY